MITIFNNFGNFNLGKGSRSPIEINVEGTPIYKQLITEIVNEIRVEATEEGLGILTGT